MTATTHFTTILLARLQQGDPSALNALIGHTCDRLRHLTHRMLRCYPVVGRWEQTDDVLQNAQLRLCRALAAQVPESVRHFYSLATLQIRRALLDLTDRYQGPEGIGANHHTDSTGGAVDRSAGRTGEPSSPAEWREFHQIIDGLPDGDREVFDLLWYQDLTHEEAAEVLDVSVRTMKRRWQDARQRLAEALIRGGWAGGEPLAPEIHGPMRAGSPQGS